MSSEASLACILCSTSHLTKKMVKEKNFYLHLSFCSSLFLLFSFSFAHDLDVYDPHNCSCILYHKHRTSSSGQDDHQSQNQPSSSAPPNPQPSASNSSSSSSFSSSSSDTSSSSSPSSSSSSSLPSPSPSSQSPPTPSSSQSSPLPSSPSSSTTSTSSSSASSYSSQENQNKSSSSFSSQENHKSSSYSSSENNQTSSSSSSKDNQKTSSSSSSSSQQTYASSSLNSTYKGTFTKIYAFGDSYTDTGNAALLDGLKSFIGSLLSQSPYGSTTSLSGQRLSNGRLVIDFLCETLGLPPLQAYKQTSTNFTSGVNFAVAGSTSLSSDYFASHRISHTLMWKANPVSFQTQIDWFNKFLLGVDCKGKSEGECKSEMEDTLFWLGAIGGSDYARIVGSSIYGRWLTELAVGNVCKILKTLLDRGAKYVVVQGLVPTGCCPISLLLCPLRDRDNRGCASSANAMIMAHNNLLQKRLAEFRTRYPNCVIVYADTWSAYQAILTNHRQYQFVEPYKACCGAGGGILNFDLHSLCGSTGTTRCSDPNRYINWDGIHLTEAMHKQVAQLLFHQGYCNPSFDQLIQAKKGK